jgi:hypothetical protein
MHGGILSIRSILVWRRRMITLRHRRVLFFREANSFDLSGNAFQRDVCYSYTHASTPLSNILRAQTPTQRTFLASRMLLTPMPTSKSHGKTSEHTQSHPRSRTTAFPPHIDTRSPAQSARNLAMWNVRGSQLSALQNNFIHSDTGFRML